MSRRTFLTVFLTLTPCLGLLPSCSHSQPVWPDKPGKRVLATFAPIYCFAQAIAGDDANVMCLLTSKGPHDSETTTQDAMKVAGADLVLANGLGLDDELLYKLIGSTGKKVKAVYIGNELDKTHHDLLEDTDHDEDHGHDKHKGHDQHKDGHHHHGTHDPHIWLSPDLAMLMVDVIADELSALDSGKKDNFRKRADKLKEELRQLKAYGLEKFKDKKNRNIVTQHDSLAYFAREFKLNIVGQIRSQKGSDEGNMEALIKQWKTKEKRPSVLTFEPQYPQKEVDSMQDSLKKEGIDTNIAKVDTIETAVGDPDPEPGYYLEKMRENIDNLAKALQ